MSSRTFADTHAELTALWLRVGDDFEARRKRAGFIQHLQPNASKLSESLGCNYERARRLLCGTLPTVDEAKVLVHLFRTRNERSEQVVKDLAVLAEASDASTSEG